MHGSGKLDLKHLAEMARAKFVEAKDA